MKYMKSTSTLLFFVGLCSLPATASSVLFSDLGPGGTVYSTASGRTIQGFSCIPAPSCGSVAYTIANLFTVVGSGSEPVSQIDLAVGHVNGNNLNTFTASIWSDVSGAPGSQIANAFWSLSTTSSSNTCCALVSITGISGVALSGGAQYFLVLGPVSTTDSSWNVLANNTQGFTGDEQYSNNGGASWINNGAGVTLGAFDVLSGSPTTSTPEPANIVAVASGLLSILACRYRRKRKRTGEVRWIVGTVYAQTNNRSIRVFDGPYKQPIEPQVGM